MPRVFAGRPIPGRRRLQGSLRVWDRKERKPHCDLDGYPGSVNSLAFSPDGSLLYSGDTAGFVRIWQLTTRRHTAGFQAHRPGIGGVVALAASPDGRRIATVGFFERQVRLWDAASGASRGSLPVAQGVNGLAFSPGEPLVALALADGTAVIWDFETARPLIAVRATGKPLRSVVFSSCGNRIVTGSSDGTVRVWEASRAGENAQESID